MAQLNLIPKRAGNRGAVTRLLTKLKGITDNPDLAIDLKIHELDKKLAELQIKLKLVQSLDDQILDTIENSDDIETEVNNADQFNSAACDARDSAEFVLSSLRREISENSFNDSNLRDPVHVPVASSSPALSAPNFNSSNLPKFDLPEFNGDILLWGAFWDVFEAEVDAKAHYSSATKFNFLNSRLKGEAKSILVGLTPNNVNYPKAIDLLKERYGQPKKIIAAHMRALFHMTKPGSDRASLRTFSDKLESYIRGLDALGKGTEAYGDLLVCILIDKLSADVRRNLARQHGTTEWTLDELRTALKKEIDILEDVLDQPAAYKSTASTSKQASVLFSGAQPTKKRKCPFCTGDHSPNFCKNVTSPEERLKIVRVKRICINCLSGTHNNLKDCNSRFRCQHCSKLHHTSLHFSNQPDTNSTISESAPPQVNVTIVATSSQTIATNSCSSTLSQPFVFLKTAIVYVQSRLAKQRANILLDEGAQRTFITSKLAKTLRLQPMWRESLVLAGFYSNPTDQNHYDVTQFSILDLAGSPITIQAIILDNLVSPLEDVNRKALTTLPHLQSLELAHPPTGSNYFPVDILIGANFYWSIVGDRVIRGPGPTAVNSKIGYLVSGPLTGVCNTRSEQSLSIHVSTVEQFDISQFWTLESLGIQPEAESTNTTNSYQDRCIEFRTKKYVARLPWRLSHPELLPNFMVCLRRTRGTVKRLAKDTKLIHLYDQIIREQLDRGFIEKVPSDDLKGTRSCHYIPHFGVEKESSTTPLRIVFDCSCKTRTGVSLNDCLEIGPPLQNDMLAILLRFRLHRIALTADIEKAFHQIGLHEDDRDFIRFLWIKDINNLDSDFEVYRFKVIPFGASSSPFILLSVLKKHLKQLCSPIATDMDSNIYVDNLITGCDTTNEALSYYESSNTILQQAGLKLQSWSSSDKIVTARAASDKVSEKSVDSKILGLFWERSADCLRLPVFHLSSFCHPSTTKRDVLRGISTVYDPLGFISPLTIPAKILIQELWKEKFEWDDPLPLIYRERWNGIALAIESAQPTLQRPYFDSKADVKNLHVFVDASQQAYGAVAYLCSSHCTTFLMSKSRVAPLKGKTQQLTLPQLELMAALIGSRLAKSITAAFKPLNISLKITMWSDSQIVLHWLTKSERNKCVFVANRVKTIQEFNDLHSAEWHYCPTDVNPADLLTRGIPLKQFLSSSLWFSGPVWLKSPADWPIWTAGKITASVLHLAFSSTIAIPVEPHNSEIDISSFIDISRFHWISLLRVTAYVYRYRDNCRLKDRSSHSLGPLTANDLRKAEVIWIRSFQRRFLPNELSYLLESKGARPALVSQLDLFLDKDGIIKCKGRLEHAQIITSAKHPILIPKACHLTTLIIQYFHERMLHCGPNITVCSIRQRYWIPSIRQKVKAVLRLCVKCRRVNGAPFTAPNHAPLPAIRVSEAPPFTVTGIDYTGAYTIRGSTKTADSKAYICLFTCASTRAIHLEVVEDLSAHSFLLAFRCFTTHHSLPSIIVSDNATTFECAANVLRKMFQSPEITNYLSNRQVEWRFIPKRAPWYGGFWERLIDLTKTALKKMIGRTKLTLNEFRTLTAEVEVVLNDRPLTKPSADLHEEEALTPSHLMYGRRFSSLPYDNVSVDEIDDPNFGQNPSDLSKAMVRIQKIKNSFWKRWSTDYLTSLREFHQATRGNHKTIIKTGDVVLVHDDCPRINWKLAVVESLIHSKDGEIRAAEIRTANGRTNRPISKLYPLEITEPDGPEIKSSTKNRSESNTSSRPKRQAAVAANARIREMANDT